MLFDGSFGLPAIKGYGYPHTADSRNIIDDEDGVLTSESYWPTSNSNPTVYTSYNNPSVAQQPVSVPTLTKLPNAPSAPQVERLVNGVSREWGLENTDKPLSFPLRPNYRSDPVNPQPGSSQPHATSLNVGSSNSEHPSPSTSTNYASSTARYDLVLSYTPPSLDSWEPEPISSEHMTVDFSTGGHEADSSKKHNLVFEEVFRFPSNAEPSAPSHGGISNSAGEYSQAHYISEGSLAENAVEPSFPHYPAHVRAQPVAAPGKGSSSSSYQPHKRTYPQVPQKPVSRFPKVVFQRVSQLILPPRYIIQSRNGYKQRKQFLSISTYLPGFPSPMPVSSVGVKEPVSYPAAPKGIKNPKRTKW